MKTKIGIALVILLLSVVVGVARDRSSEVLRVKDGKTISFDRMIAEASTKDIIFVGEVHDDPEHHRLNWKL